MPSVNYVCLMGNLTRDPEVKNLPSGSAVADLRLAMNEKYTNKAGQLVEKVCYVDVSVWGRQAEACGQYLSKGSAAVVEGSLEYDEWEKDGQKRSRLRVRAQRVQFVGRKESAGEGSGGAARMQRDELQDGPPPEPRAAPDGDAGPPF